MFFQWKGLMDLQGKADSLFFSKAEEMYKKNKVDEYFPRPQSL